MEDEVKVIARMDKKKKVRLYHVLLDEGITFSGWLRRQIDAYIRRRRSGTEEHRTNPMGLWTYASNFFEAASAVEDRLGRRNISTVYFLYCRSIELVIKAYLRSREIGVKPLLRVGHDLDALMDAADRENLKSLVTLKAYQVDAIKRINTYYKAKELEYIVTGYKQYPPIEHLRSCASTLIDVTKGVCLKGRNR